jgi:hypothetical protein
MGMKDHAKNWATTLRLDSHHAMERFGVLFVALTLSFVVIFGTAATTAVSNERTQLGSTALYTPTFTTSKTQLDGDVHGVYVSTDRTRAMVLMQFSDTSSVSANSERYQGFLTGATKELADEPLKSNVSGEIVTFGPTGYLAMVLDSETPFEQQILNLTMRSNSELVFLPSEKRKVREDLEGQKTFAEFDQWRLYFNPGASGAETVPALDSETFDAGAVYADLVIAPDEAVVRQSMDDQLAQMQVDQARIAEYESEMDRVNVDGIFLTPPTVPEQIAGDEVTGSAPVDGKDSTLTLKPKWVSPSGYDFDWRGGSVTEGYLDDLVSADDSYVTFLAEKASLSKNGDEGAVRLKDEAWALSNGRLLSDYGTSSDKAMEPLREIKNDLSQAYQDYFSHKVDYQVTTYGQLLDLEVALRTVRTGASNNDSDKALFTY